MEITVTEKMLRLLEPCRAALEVVLPLLPVQISTEPQDNLEIAERLVALYRVSWRRNLMADLRWFIQEVAPGDWSEEARELYMRSFDQNIHLTSFSPQIVRDILAFVTKKLTRRMESIPGRLYLR